MPGQLTGRIGHPAGVAPDALAADALAADALAADALAADALAAELRGAVPFRHLDDGQLAQLADRGWVKEAAQDEVLCRVGDESDGLHVVLTGGFRLSRPGPGGTDVDLGARGPGESFGEPSLLHPSPRSATVLATGPSRFFVLPRPAFLAYMSESPEAMAGLLAGIGDELRQAQEHIFFDILNEHLLQVQLHAERYRSLAQLVAGVAHEVNTPLGIINTAASYLADDLSAVVDRAGPVAGPVRDAIEAAELIARNLDRVSRLVERFKSLSASSAAAALEPTDVMTVVDGVLALFAPRSRMARIDIETVDERADPETPWTGNAGILAEVLLNLLANVEQHAYPDGAGGPAQIVVKDDGPEHELLEVVVSDRGRGIPARDLDLVWEPFFTTSRARGGTGLGLSVVRNLVTDGMFGTVEISSIPGAETTARLRFPRLPPPQDR